MGANIFSDTEMKIISKNVKAVMRYIENEIRPRLKEKCQIAFGDGDGWGQRHSIVITPTEGEDVCGVYASFNEREVIKFSDKVYGYLYKSAYTPGIGMEYSFELLRNWKEIKRRLLLEVERQNETETDSVTRKDEWLNAFVV